MMVENRTAKVLRSGLLTLWGLATLILVGCLALLLYGRTEQGENPLDITIADRPVPNLPPLVTRDTPTTTRDVQIYFADANGVRLQAELHSIPFVEDTVANCRAALSRLIDGPREGLTPVIPDATEIRGIYLLDSGELVVDFAKSLEAGQIKTASAELLMARAVVATLVQPRLAGENDTPVLSVRFLFEGSPPQDMFPAHIDLSEPLGFEKSWVAVASNG